MLTSEQEDILDEVFEHSENDNLTGWEKDRLKEWGQMYEEKGAKFFISPKMWMVINKIHEKIYGK